MEDFTTTWSTIAIKEIKNKFYKNFVASLKAYPLQRCELWFYNKKLKKGKGKIQMKVKRCFATRLQPPFSK
jgi:hypothetical protein